MSYANDHKSSAAREFDGLIEMRDLASTKNISKIKRQNSGNASDMEGRTPLLANEDNSPTQKAPVRKSGLPQEQKYNLFQRIYFYFTQYPVSTVDRIISFDQSVYPPNKFENIIRNQKYSIYSFVFIVLFNQFKFFFNLFFLIIALSQFIEPLKVGFLFTYIAPLAFVLILTMLKEAFDDFKRYKRDKEANSQLYKVFVNSTTKVDMPSSDIKVGQIIEVHANQRIPADLILLYTSDESGTVFIRTDQLDGETDWKLRKPIKYTQKIAVDRGLFGINARITCEPPKAQIYDFIGLLNAESKHGPDYREPLSLENTLWANTVLASGTIYAMVAYTGRETRMAMNSREPRSKIGNLDLELNAISKYLFVFMLCMSLIIMVLRGFGKLWVIQYFKYMLLLSSIIPISLRVNLDFAKAIFSHRINIDNSIEGTVARNSTIPEELGRVQFLLTDKTGTLTQNDMIFKKLCLEKTQYDENSLDEMAKALKKQCTKYIGPAKDVEEHVRAVVSDNPTGLTGKVKRNKGKRATEVVLRDLITALCVCHNVTPVIEDGEKTYQASSPDEVALVKIAESINMTLLERTQSRMIIQNAAGVKETYEILANFPFSSETKRMGIVVRNLESNRLIFYLKGADAIMKHKLPENQRAFVMDEVEELAKMGLRTLIISQKYITENEFKEWFAQYEDANAVLQNRDAAVRKVVESLETEMEFLGITGVEDKLQEDVSSTIESLRDAGLGVWMLTGDKVETAYCIAISAGFKSNKQGAFFMKDLEDPLEIQNHLAQFNNKATTTVLFIDGGTLHATFENHKKYFFDVACKAPAVVCCRVSPTQKALITEAIKEFQGQTVCGIGDGGNDVGMIQSADVGVGIVGKEGKQAALAADYSVMKFKYIKPLLLWHGRNAYKRTAVMAQFVIHRGLIITIIQALFTTIFYYVAIPVYNGYLMLGYTTLYTMFPVFCLVFDYDVSKKVAETYAPLYQTLQLGRELNIKTFLIWAWKSIYQGGIIMLFTIVWFQDSYLNIVTITFTALILAELLNVYSEVNKKKSKILLISQIGTFGIYACSMIFMRNYINVSRIDGEFIGKVIVLTLISWLPLHLAKWAYERWSPSDDMKIMKRAKVFTQQEEEAAQAQ